MPADAAPLRTLRRSAGPSVSLRGPRPGAGSSLLRAEARGREGGESSCATSGKPPFALEGALLVWERARATVPVGGGLENH